MAYTKESSSGVTTGHGDVEAHLAEMPGVPRHSGKGTPRSVTRLPRMSSAWSPSWKDKIESRLEAQRRDPDRL